MAPVTATLVRGKSHRLYQHLAEWHAVPGADAYKFLNHTVVYPSLRPGLLLRDLGDDLVIHDPSSFDCHTLNRPAAEILRLSNGTRNLAAITRDYMSCFDLDAGTARADVFLTLEDLIEKKIVVPRTTRSN